MKGESGGRKQFTCVDDEMTETGRCSADECTTHHGAQTRGSLYQ